jgi:predicted Zn-ribbon and HTH transcriptional regulator
MSDTTLKRSVDEIEVIPDYRSKLRARRSKPVYTIDHLNDEEYFEAVDKLEKLEKEKEEKQDKIEENDEVCDECDEDDDEHVTPDMQCPTCDKDIISSQLSCDGCGYVVKFTKHGYVDDGFVKDTISEVDASSISEESCDYGSSDDSEEESIEDDNDGLQSDYSDTDTGEEEYSPK